MSTLASTDVAPVSSGTVEQARLGVLAYACEHGLRVTITYRKKRDGVEVPRVVSPHTMHRSFVVAYDWAAHAPRSFRFDRIARVTI